MAANHVPHVLVLGASGRVGGQVCRQLVAAGARVRAATRHPEALPVGLAHGSAAVDLADPPSLSAALDGVDAVHLLWPFFESAEEARRRAEPIAELLGAHVRRVVYVSSQGVEEDRETFWAAVEDAVAAHVPERTFLRPTGFAANALQWAPQIAGDRAVRFAFGDMARPLIHEADIAAVAVEALLREGHHRHAYVLTGPGMVTQREQVQAIAAALGTELAWEEMDRERAEAELDLPGMMLDAWEHFLEDPEPVTDEVQRLTGRPSRPFSQWAEENAALFR
ncbi:MULTISPECIES: SDR family oxidoreductase [Brachybacterium]|uniref:SDR family oxidoreductase n=1 Tax=Brachybacterium TaxID=43668 RepID=UPI0006B4607F|nr:MULTISPECIES: NAD(P)H-binding protein [Brachybacterium]GAP78957.1 oxidoreductase [Brachybacterium sp. SW0106-09]